LRPLKQLKENGAVDSSMIQSIERFIETESDPHASFDVEFLQNNLMKLADISHYDVISMIKILNQLNQGNFRLFQWILNQLASIEKAHDWDDIQVWQSFGPVLNGYPMRLSGRLG
jgi:hypothetical protein